MSLVETEWLYNNLNDVKIIDSSWHMPLTKRNGFEEFKKLHIKNAIFFDIDKNSKLDTDLPHMLTDKTSWEKIVSKMGIKNHDKIIIYDNSDVISSCRCWYNFIYYGHDPSLVSVLNGGLKKWIKEKKPTTNTKIDLKKSSYKAKEISKLVKNIDEINENIKKKNFKLIDARSLDRFKGQISEPRKGLRSGSIPNSMCLPFTELLNEDKTFINKKNIANKFRSINCHDNENLVFSCGSGITASVLALAYSLIDNKYMPTIYDGSWSEYGKI